jgi:hypothetical protein
LKKQEEVWGFFKVFKFEVCDGKSKSTAGDCKFAFLDLLFNAT